MLLYLKTFETRRYTNLKEIPTLAEDIDGHVEHSMVGQVVFSIEDDGLDSICAATGLVEVRNIDGLRLLNVLGVAEGILGVLWELAISHGSYHFPLQPEVNFFLYNQKMYKYKNNNCTNFSFVILSYFASTGRCKHFCFK